MLEVEVKNYYWDKLYGRCEFNEFANSINNETIIFYSVEDHACLILYQKDFEKIQISKGSFSQFKGIMSKDVMADALKGNGLPEKYTLIKVEKDKNYIIVSEKYRDAYDIALIEQYGKIGWEIKQTEYSKEKYESIKLAGKTQE